MGWKCPNGQCVFFSNILTNNEAKEDKYRCHAVFCGSMLEKVKEQPPVPRSSKAKTVVNKSSVTRVQQTKTCLATNQAVQKKEALVASSPKSKTVVQQPLGYKMDRVVQVGPPANLELVYPSVAQPAPEEIKAAVVRPKILALGDAVPVAVPCAPLWLKHEPKQDKKEVSETSKVVFPKGAHFFDGKVFRTKAGKIVPTAEEKLQKKQALKELAQQKRSLRRMRQCKKVRLARLAREGKEIAQKCNYPLGGGFAIPLPAAEGCMGGNPSQNCKKGDFSPAPKKKGVKKVWRQVQTKVQERPWTPEEEALVASYTAEAKASFEFDDADCIIVEKPRRHVKLERVGRVPVVETEERALEALTLFTMEPTFTEALKKRLCELWDLHPELHIEVGRLSAYLTELADEETSPSLESNFFALSLKEQEEIKEINSTLLEECQNLEGLTVKARGNMFKFAKETALSVAAKIKNGISWTADTLVEMIMKQVRKVFDSVLGHWLTPFKHLSEQIDALWSKIREWMTKVRNAMCIGIQVLQEFALYAMAGLFVGAIVVMAESALFQMGVLTKVGATLGLFLTLFLTSLNLNALAMCSEQVAHLNEAFKTGIRILLNVPADILHAGGRPSVQAKSLIGLDTAVSAITGFGKSLVTFKLGTLQYYAKLGQAFDQLARGKKAISELAAWTIDIIGEIYNKLTGRCSQFFDELSALVCCDVRLWLRSSQRVRLDALITPGSRNVLEIVEKLLEQGNKLKIGAAGVPRKFSLDFTNVICKEVEKLEEVRNQLANAGAYKGTRFYPFWVYVVGPSQCGKTNIVSQYLAPSLLDKMDCALDSQYSKGKQDAYWSDYKRQALVKVDDMFAIKDADVEPMMIDMVNSEPFPLNMAALHDKGRLFDSPLVVTTCNDLHPPSDCNLRDAPSFYNRRAVVLQMRRKAGTEYDPADTNNCSECRMLDPKVTWVNGKEEALHEPLTEWISVKEALAFIETALLEHKAKEERRINAVNEAQRGATGIMCFSRNYILEQRLTGVFIDDPDKERFGIKSSCFMFVVVDRVMYQQDASGMIFQLEKQPLMPEQEWEKMERKCVENVVYNIQAYLADSPPNGLVGTFLAHIIDETCNVKSVDSLSSSATAGEKEFWDSLQGDLRGRVYLRLCQKRKDSIAGETKDSAIDKTMEKMCRFAMDSYRYVKDNGGALCLLLAGFVTVTVSCYGLFAFMSSFFSAPSLTSGIAALEAIDAKAVMSSSSYGDAYAKKNLRPLHYYTARAPCGEEFKQSWQRMLVKIFPEAGVARGHLIQACQYEGRSLLLTRHQALSIPHGSQVYVQYCDLPGMYLFWNHDKLMHKEDREVVLYSDAILHALPEKSKKLFLYDDESNLAPSLLVDRFGYRMNSESNNILEVKQERLVAETVRETLGVVRSEGGYKYSRTINKFIRVEGKAQDWDCGTLIASLVNGQMRIIGLLVGGTSTYFTADIVPKFEQVPVRGLCRIQEEFGVQERGYAKIGYLENQDRPTMPTKSQYIQVPEEFRIEVKDCKEPSILSKDDPRLEKMGKVYDPLREGLAKYANPMDVLDEDLLKDVAGDIVTTWYDCQEGDLEDVDIDVAINGDEMEDFFDPMVMSTSEGYPFVLERKGGDGGKERYFEGLPRERKLKEGTSVAKAYDELCAVAPHAVPELICMECPKDERLPKRKILNPKTRLFAILPLHYNLRLRVKYLAFGQFIMKNRGKLPCQVGINPYSREWKELYHRLASVSDMAYNCDYSSFDGLMTYQVLNVIANMINLMYSKNETDGSQNERRNLLLAIWGRKCIAGSQVYQVNAGIPSGCALTVLLNSIFNELLVRYAFKKIVPKVYRNEFSSLVCLLVYGDDNLIAVKDVIAEVEIVVPNDKGKGIAKRVGFGKLLKDTLAEVGVTITDGTDKLSPTLEAKPLCSLDFLKRGFKKVDGFILAPLDKNAIYSSLVWVAAKNSDVMEKLRLNVSVALQELWLHQDRDEFNSTRDFFVRNIPCWKEVPTWKQVDAFHMDQLTHCKPWQPAKNIDILVRPEMKAFIDNHGYADEKFVICPKIFVAGPKYRFERDEFGISFTHLLVGESGMEHLQCILDSDVPTQQWVDKWGSPLYPPVARMRAALKAGKKLVFRGHAPYLVCWLAMMKFCIATNISDRESLQAMYANTGGKLLADLDSYFSKFEKSKALGFMRMPQIVHFVGTIKDLECVREIFKDTVPYHDRVEVPAVAMSATDWIGIVGPQKRREIGKYPLLIMAEGFSIGNKGKTIWAHKEEDLPWQEHCGKNLLIASSGVFYCNENCEGHTAGKLVGAVIVNTPKDEVDGKFYHFGGMWRDDPALKASKAWPQCNVAMFLKNYNCFRT